MATTINRVKIIRASNTKIEKEINDFFDSMKVKRNFEVKDLDVRDGDNNNVAVIRYTYSE